MRLAIARPDNGVDTYRTLFEAPENSECLNIFKTPVQFHGSYLKASVETR